MSDPLVLLRAAIISGETIVLQDEFVLIGKAQTKFPLATRSLGPPTAW